MFYPDDARLLSRAFQNINESLGHLREMIGICSDSINLANARIDALEKEISSLKSKGG